MTDELQRCAQLEAENESLRKELQAARDVLEAVREDRVDAVVVRKGARDQVYFLDADAPYRDLVEDMQEGALVLDGQRRVVYFNRPVLRLLRTSREGLLAGPFLRFVSPSSLAAFEKLLAGATGEAAREDVVLAAADGEPLFTQISARVLSCRGETAASLIVTDCSAQRRAEQALEEQQARLKVIVDAAPVLISYLDVECRYRLVNRRYEEWFGRRAEELRGRHVREVLGDAAWEVVQPYLERALAGEQVTYEREVPYRGTGRRWVHAIYTPDRGPDGRVRGIVVLVLDIEAARQAERALHESERRLARTLASISDGVVSFNRDWRCTYINGNAARMLRKSHEELLGRTFEEVFPEPTGEEFRRQCTCAAGENRAVRFEAYSAALAAWFECSCCPSPDGLSLYLRDVTERKRLENRLRRFYDSGMVGVLYSTLDGAITDANDKLLEMIGYSREELERGRVDWIRLTPPEYRALDERAIEQLRTTGLATPYEKEYVRKDGARISILLGAAALDERCSEVVAFVLDNTARKRAEESLRQSEERFRSLAHASFEGIVFTEQGKIVDANEQLAQMSGYAQTELIGMDIAALFAPEDREQVMANIVGNNDAVTEVRMVRKDGSQRIVEAHGRPVFKDRRPLRVKVLRDVTERRRIEEEVRQARRAAEEAYVAKSRFLASMSHELRTPMNAVIGMTDLVLSEELPPGARDSLETVRSSADALLALLNELLDFSRLEAGKVVLEAAPFRLRPLLGEVLKAMSVLAAEKGLEFAEEIAAETPDGLVGDPLRLRQVLTNLLSNALKFTREGEVRLRVRLDSRTVEEARLRFEVADTGIGIAPEHLAHIFEPFIQAEASTTRHFGGTGLGLAITSNLVRLMGGEISVQSEVGRGSRFSFTVLFPVSAGPVPEPASPARRSADLPRPTRSLRVLLAEDTPANRKLVVRVLQRRGHTVEVAGNGLDAIRLLAQQDFDVVLMDVEMPVLDGFEATSRIRGLEDGAKARVPIIAMTAHAQKSDQERCLAGGMDAYISKPIDIVELIELVERTGTNRSSGRPDA